MIRFDRVTRRFERPPSIRRPASSVTAVRDVSLELGPGVTAVVGPNGAGKSTLFALLLGFLRPSEGRVRIDGDSPRRYIRRHGAGYLPERFSLPDGWTVASGLCALARLEGLDGGEAARRADAALDRFGLGEHADKPVDALSRGLLQRLGLAQALLAPRELIVLDEPTEGLDPLWRIRLRTMVDELGDDGRTVLLASHDLAEVERLADRVVLMDAGAVQDVLELGESDEPAARYRLELAGPADAAMRAAFPDATPARDGRRGERRSYEVAVPDAIELSRRLAALIEAGGTIAGVAPLHEPLEDRVRHAFEAERGGGGGA